jgi:hypothetical protein
MPITFSMEPGSLAVFRISGILKKAELDAEQRKLENEIHKLGRLKILVLPDAGFDGWEQNENWADMSFAARHDRHIEKIAIVGGPQWRDMVYAFMGKGLRPEPIRYFDLGQEAAARLWLNTPQAV